MRNLFTKKPQKKPQEDPHAKPKLLLVWDTDLAKEVYVLKMVSEYFTGRRFAWYWDDVATGDRAWAKRTAAHYGIELPSSRPKGSK